RDQGAVGEAARGGLDQFRERSFDGVHAVNSSCSRLSAAVNAVLSAASPRWTWAFRVPSGRSSASAISVYERPSTWRRTIATRWAGGSSARRSAQTSL